MEDSKVIIYQTPDGQTSIDVTLEDDTVWLTQAQMVALFQQTRQNISLHINNIYKELELDKNSTVKESLTVQKEGSRTVKRRVAYYSLDVIISVGYRVKSQRGTQFRIWAMKKINRSKAPWQLSIKPLMARSCIPVLKKKPLTCYTSLLKTTHFQTAIKE